MDDKGPGVVSNPQMNILGSAINDIPMLEVVTQEINGNVRIIQFLNVIKLGISTALLGIYKRILWLRLQNCKRRQDCLGTWKFEGREVIYCPDNNAWLMFHGP